MVHIPVLQKEVLGYLDPKPNENFIDATIGEGGHTLAILEKNRPRGKVLGIELDSELYKKLKKDCLKWSFKQRVVLVNDSYINLEEIVQRENFKQISGILFDLGMSSWHLEESGRGFSFLKEEPLDMRYNPQNPLTAEKIINFWSKIELERFLKEYGEERFAKIIAREIIEARKLKPIKTTFDLVKIIGKSVPNWYLRQKIHFATRTFQALRITVNDELSNLEKALPQALEILAPKGRLVIISFHSLEDRVAKNFLKNQAKEGLPQYQKQALLRGRLKILTKKSIRPTAKEIKINPRSRSAKLRAAIKI